jgi:hypothetical protein
MSNILLSSEVLVHDRKQIGIVGKRMFDKNRVHFMNA